MMTVNNTLCLVISLLAFTACVNGLRCLECQDSPNPQLCNTITQCPPGDLCYVEQYITSGGLILFSTGCMSTMRCTVHKRGLREVTEVRKRSGDVVTCVECCHGEFCNVEGCGETAIRQPVRGPVCFHCDAQAGPDQCRSIAKCEIGELCSLGKHHDYDTIWRSQCSSMLQCQQLKQNATTSTSCDCCSTDFCNDQCRHSSSTSTAGLVTNTATVTTVSTSQTDPSTSFSTVAIHTTASQSDTPTVHVSTPVHSTASQTDRHTTNPTVVVHTTTSQTSTPTVHVPTSVRTTALPTAVTKTTSTTTTTTRSATTQAPIPSTSPSSFTITTTTSMKTTKLPQQQTTSHPPSSSPTPAHPDPTCENNPVDVCFVLDSSGSQSHQFHKELHVVREVMHRLSVGKPSANHACLVTYNTNAKVVIPLNNQFTNAEIMHAVMQTHFTTGESRTDLGLLAALRELEHQHWQARKNIVVLTDGRSTLPTLTHKAVKHIQSRDPSVHIHAIGFGDDIVRSQLEMMATDLSKVHVTNNSQIPSTMFQDVIQQLCTGASPKTSIETTTVHGHHQHHNTHSSKIHGHHHTHSTRDTSH